VRHCKPIRASANRTLRATELAPPKWQKKQSTVMRCEPTHEEVTVPSEPPNLYALVKIIPIEREHVRACLTLVPKVSSTNKAKQRARGPLPSLGGVVTARKLLQWSRLGGRYNGRAYNQSFDVGQVPCVDAAPRPLQWSRLSGRYNGLTYAVFPPRASAAPRRCCATAITMVASRRPLQRFRLCSERARKSAPSSRAEGQVKLILYPKLRAKPAAGRTRTCTNAAVC
jgi:hypothetical protein